MELNQGQHPSECNETVQSVDLFIYPNEKLLCYECSNFFAHDLFDKSQPPPIICSSKIESLRTTPWLSLGLRSS